MTLTDFLLARIGEDEATAREAIAERIRVRPDLTSPDIEVDALDWPSVVAVGGERFLAECEAKRRIVEMWSARFEQADHPTIGAHATGLGLAIRALAVVYADHPDYDEAWRP